MRVEIEKTDDGKVLLSMWGTEDKPDSLTLLNIKLTRDELQLLGEYALDSDLWVGPCPVEIYPKSLYSPAEYCQNTSVEGGTYCREHEHLEEI